MKRNLKWRCMAAFHTHLPSDMRPILLAGQERSLTQVKFNPDGDLLFSTSKDQVVNVWFWHNGERLGTFEGHQGAVWSVDCNLDTSLIITGSADSTARLWEIRTGRLLHTWETKTAVKWVAFSSDNKYALLVTERRMGFPGSVMVVDIKGANEEQNPEPVMVIEPKGSKAQVGGWGPFDKFIITGHEDGSISQWNWQTSELLNSAKYHELLVTDIQFAEDRTYFITSSKDCSAHILDSKTLQLLKTYKAADKTPLNSAALTPSPAEFVVIGGGQDAMIVTQTSQRAGKFECRFFNKIFEQEVGRVKGHFGPINTIAVHPSGKGFASGGEDGFIRLHQFDDDYVRLAEESTQI